MISLSQQQISTLPRDNQFAKGTKALSTHPSFYSNSKKKWGINRAQRRINRPKPSLITQTFPRATKIRRHLSSMSISKWNISLSHVCSKSTRESFSAPKQVSLNLQWTLILTVEIHCTETSNHMVFIVVTKQAQWLDQVQCLEKDSQFLINLRRLFSSSQCSRVSADSRIRFAGAARDPASTLKVWMNSTRSQIWVPEIIHLSITQEGLAWPIQLEENKITDQFSFFLLSIRFHLDFL